MSELLFTWETAATNYIEDPTSNPCITIEILIMSVFFFFLTPPCTEYSKNRYLLNLIEYYFLCVKKKNCTCYKVNYTRGITQTVLNSDFSFDFL